MYTLEGFIKNVKKYYKYITTAVLTTLSAICIFRIRRAANRDRDNVDTGRDSVEQTERDYRDTKQAIERAKSTIAEIRKQK